MQKQAVALNELHEQNGVAWDTIDNVLYFALNSQWWGKKVQSTYDMKRYFNEIPSCYWCRGHRRRQLRR